MVMGWKHMVGLVVAGGLGALLLVWSGIIGVGASTGHWKATDWFLHWAMRSSVRTAALGTTVPSFTEGMLPMAAGHFEQGCALCHGSPGTPAPASVRNMLPVPPELKDKIPAWTDAELFQIVQHGIRFTGMPAWPVASREDEAWAMVSFLRRYQELTASDYRTLAGYAATRSKKIERLTETCNGCHAPERLAASSLVPRLAGQSLTYMQQALAAYASNARPSGVMAVATEGLSEDERKNLVAIFARQAPSAPMQPMDQSLKDRGERLANHGDPARNIPACLNCHEKDDGNAAIPRLSGQPSAYLVNQLRLFREKRRGGGPYHLLMTRAVEHLEEEDVEPLANYFMGRHPSR
ncbi:c-type cytochrome [Agrobacterium tumefaciens]|nr:c-type cytochrome [Agrobacterium tumefaciens]